MKLSKLGIFSIISLLSYAAMVVFSPLAYPGYNWMSMAVSELSAVGAPSKTLAEQLNSLFGPCGIVGIMAVCVGAANFKSKCLRIGIYLFAIMEWVTIVGYNMFPWVANTSGFNLQNMIHLAITAFVVFCSIAALIVIIVGAKKEKLKSLGTWGMVCLGAMFVGAIGTMVLPNDFFGIAERFSTFSVVVFNAVLGYYLLSGRFD